MAKKVNKTKAKAKTKKYSIIDNLRGAINPELITKAAVSRSSLVKSKENLDDSLSKISKSDDSDFDSELQDRDDGFIPRQVISRSPSSSSTSMDSDNPPVSSPVRELREIVSDVPVVSGDSSSDSEASGLGYISGGYSGASGVTSDKGYLASDYKPSQDFDVSKASMADVERKMIREVLDRDSSLKNASTSRMAQQEVDPSRWRAQQNPDWSLSDRQFRGTSGQQMSDDDYKVKSELAGAEEKKHPFSRRDSERF